MRWVALVAVHLASGSIGQVAIGPDFVADRTWQEVSVERARTLFNEVPTERATNTGRAYLVGGGCIPVNGPYVMKFERAGVTLLFTPLDSMEHGRLKSAIVTKSGMVITPMGVDIGEALVSEPNTDGSEFRVVEQNGKKYLEQFRSGVFYYCKPASISRARKGKTLNVAWFKVFEY